jgi:hypothetical protein
MVYIPPLPNSQYSQYAEREVKNKHDPFHFVPVHRASPIKSGQQYILTAKSEQVPKSIKIKKASIVKAKAKRRNSKLISELTGKGVNFDETI